MKRSTTPPQRDDQNPSDTSTAIWLWLFPFIYLIHLFEEYFGGGGYSAYILRTRGINLTPVRFLTLNGLGWALMSLGIMLARSFKFPEWLLVCFGAVVLANGVSHTTSSVLTAEYNPGVISGLLIFIPFGGVTLFRLQRRMRRRRFRVAVLVGIGIQALISLLVLSGGK